MLEILPPEIVSQILECVMESETPFDISVIFMNITWRRIPPDQISHVNDWIVATSVCHDFNIHGQRAFFLHKIFTVPPDLLGQYPTASGTAPLDTTKWHRTRDRLFAQARQIIVPLPTCAAATSFLILPRYQPRFTNLQCLIIWPRTDMWPNIGHIATVPAPDSENNQREPASKEQLGLLRWAGVDVDRVEINVVYSREELLRWSELSHLEQAVYPYVRVGMIRLEQLDIAIPIKAVLL
ncbi:MAG: hypothetical protein Q9186_007551 [Xanthomendoza sp. 1 TL-2023]